MTGDGTEWLRRKAHPSSGVPMERHTPNQQEWYSHTSKLPQWPPVSRIAEADRHIHRGDGFSNAPAVEWYGGPVRRSPSFSGSGLVPGYIPSGAEFDRVTPNSTRNITVNGLSPWSLNLDQILEDAAALAVYHWRADAIKQEEAEDWDIPVRRRPAVNPVFDSTDEHMLEERYRKMCEYKGWHYEPLITLPAERVDDDWRHAS